MTPREFLSKQGYESALLLTWSFDPLFFERVYLRLLHAGGTGQVAVVMDSRRLAELEQRLPQFVEAGNVACLGTEYALDGARTEGHFHPKLWLRSGEKGALVWVGSCNLTEFGWNGQWELGTAWEVGPEQPDKGGWLRAVLEDLKSLCRREGTIHAIERMLSAQWLPKDPEGKPPVLWTGQQTLAQQLEDRWRDLRFERARMLTGSTDDRAAMARWTADTFGVKRFELALTPDRCDLQAAKVQDVPFDFRIVAFDGAPRPLHAKLLWLEGDGGQKAVMGSMNFSASAWLRPTARGGNYELVAIYENPDAEGFAEQLKDCEQALDAQSFLASLPDSTSTSTEPPPGEERMTIVEALWDSVIGELRLRIEPAPKEGAIVELVEQEAVPMALSGDLWTVEVERSPGPWCLRVRIRDGDLVRECTSFVDNQRELRATVGTRRWSAFFDKARGTTSSSEQRKMVEDFSRLRAALFQPSKPASSKSGGETRTREEETPGSPLDPALLAGAKVVYTGLTFVPGASLRGGIGELLRSIFDFEKNDDSDEPEIDDDGEVITRSGGPGGTNSLHRRTVERLCEEMDSFFGDLKNKELAAKGSPVQLQQAFALPIALALLGLEGEWLRPDIAGAWVKKTLEIMLDDKLLAQAVARFATEDRQKEAAQLLGDGALLAAARVAVAVVPWPNRLRRALTLRQLDDTPELRSCATLEVVERLLGCVRVTADHRAARDTAFEDIASLRKLEQSLEQQWDELAQLQDSARGEWLRAGEDVRLRSGAWGVIENEELLLDDPRPEVRLSGGAARRVSVKLTDRKSRKTKTILLDLGFLSRMGAELPPTNGLLDLEEGAPVGPRETAAKRQKIRWG